MSCRALICAGNIFDHKEDNFRIILSRILDLNDTKFSFFKALMTAHWVLERLFWPYIQSLGPLRPNFGKNSANIFDHKEDTLRIILSPISGPLEQ